MTELDRAPLPADSRPPEIPSGSATPGAFPPTVTRTVREGGVCVLTFDRPDSAANILDPGTLLELAEHLDFIELHTEITGLVFATGKASIFVAGADLNAMRGEARLAQVGQFIEHGQAVMNRIAALPIPTAEGIKTILAELATTVPAAKNADPEQFVAYRIAREIEASGFVKKLYEK